MTIVNQRLLAAINTSILRYELLMKSQARPIPDIRQHDLELLNTAVQQAKNTRQLYEAILKISGRLQTRFQLSRGYAFHMKSVNSHLQLILKEEVLQKLVLADLLQEDIVYLEKQLYTAIHLPSDQITQTELPDTIQIASTPRSELTLFNHADEDPTLEPQESAYAALREASHVRERQLSEAQEALKLELKTTQTKLTLMAMALKKLEGRNRTLEMTNQDLLMMNASLSMGLPASEGTPLRRLS